jgi:hypothetical protein
MPDCDLRHRNGLYLELVTGEAVVVEQELDNPKTAHASGFWGVELLLYASGFRITSESVVVEQELDNPKAAMRPGFGV